MPLTGVLANAVRNFAERKCSTGEPGCVSTRTLLIGVRVLTHPGSPKIFISL
jgi:hypothetical protein